MSGFVGSRARKKRRNTLLTLFLFIVLGFFIIILPKLEISNSINVPNENIIPDPIEDLNSLASKIEELELNLFNRDQKIKFRDGQIINLQTELKNTQLEYEAVIMELNEINNEYSALSSNNKNLVSLNKYNLLQDNYTELNIENDNNILKIKNLNKKNKELNNKNKELNNKLVQINDLILENQQLKKDAEDFLVKKLKFENSIINLNKIISDQKIEIDLHLEQIKKLKDRSHHGG